MRWSRVAVVIVYVLSLPSCSNEPSLADVPAGTQVTVAHLQTASADFAIYRGGAARPKTVLVDPEASLRMTLPEVDWSAPSLSGEYALLVVSRFGWRDQYWELAQQLVLRSNLEVLAVMPRDGRGFAGALGLVPPSDVNGTSRRPSLASMLGEASVTHEPLSVLLVAGDTELMGPGLSSRVVTIDSASPPTGSLALYTTATPFSLLTSAAEPTAGSDLPFAVANIEAGLGVVELSAVCDINPAISELIQARGIGGGIAQAVNRRCTPDGRLAASRLVEAVADALIDPCGVRANAPLSEVFNESKPCRS